MNDPNRLMKWLLIIAMVVLALVILYPPQRKLKGGIDLVGGTSLLFEIDTSGLKPTETRDLSTRVMRVLKDRVDPKGQLNLEWRPVGSTRLEIRLPRPPREALERRAAYNAAIDGLQAKNIKRRDVEMALSAAAESRSAAFESLVRGLPARSELLTKLASAYDALQKSKPTGSQGAVDAAAIDSASKAYEEAMSALLATNLPIGRLTDVLALAGGGNRVGQIDKLRKEYAVYDGGEAGKPDGKLLSRAIEAYDAWAANKADLEDPSDLKRRLQGAGVLEFRILAERDASTPTQLRDPNPQLAQPIAKYTEQLAKYGPRPKTGDRYHWFAIDDPLRFSDAKDMEEFKKRKDSPGGAVIEEYAGRFYVLMHDDPENRMVKGSGQGRSWELRSASPDRNPMTGENVVSFSLNPTGGQIFGELTGKNVQRQLAILLDQQAISHATIRERITEHCQISGRFSPERVNELVGVLEAGSLPARLKETPLSEETVGPSLGETNRRNGLFASALGAALVALFALVYYGVAGGGIANVALALNILFTLAAMALMQSTFTLPGIAGVVLTVGMAIDANVLIFERIREERARGVPFKKALNLGYERAFSAIFDSNVSTLISCVILGAVAKGEVKGFAITLGIGLATSMFTALFCTRLAFNSMIAKGWIEDLHMRRLIGVPKIDWIGLRRYFLPASAMVTGIGLIMFLYVAINRTEELFDIEFIGGTALQLDLKPGVNMTDEDIREAVTATGANKRSSVQWLNQAAERLKAANAESGEVPGQFTLTSKDLSGDEMAVLMRETIEPMVEPHGIKASGSTATFLGKGGLLTIESFRGAVDKAADAAREGATRLRGARVQSVSEKTTELDKGLSYELVTVETNRPLVQQSILAVLGDKLAVQRAIHFTTARDADLTRQPFFVVEAEDHYLSDVLGGDAPFDIRRFRGGVVVETTLDESEGPITVDAFEARLREVGLAPEFEQFRTRETAVFPLGAGTKHDGGGQGYKRFAVCSVDEAVLYDEDQAQWMEVVAPSVLHQVEAALGSEKSFNKVVQFAPSVAGQARNRALFAMALAWTAIAVYVWFRFKNRAFGLAAVVALFHDVAVTLGLIGLSHFIYDNPIARFLLFEDFKVDPSMVAAILTIIGYSLNDTIVVYDRIRENRGRSGTLSAATINASINQTLSRTILTSFTVFITVFVLYVIGGKGVHGFSVAMLMGVITGTYSTVAIAVVMVYNTRILANVVWMIVALCLIGLVFLIMPGAAWRAAACGVIVIGAIVQILRTGHSTLVEHPVVA